MNARIEQVLNIALALPEGDRAELVDALIASLPSDIPPFDESLREVIARRSAELSSGQVVPISWGEVKRRVRERHGRAIHD